MTTASADWTVLERLLLAQAVNKYGEDDWFQVARTLKQHPLLQGQERLEVFNQKNCSLQYYLMIENLETESRRQHKSPSNMPSQDMPNVVKLARQLYKQRVEDLKRNIKEDEEQFLKLVSEIDDIKSGAWDNKLATLTNEQQKEQSASITNSEDNNLSSDQQPSPMNIDESILKDDDNNNINNSNENNNNNGNIYDDNSSDNNNNSIKNDLDNVTPASNIINSEDDKKEYEENQGNVNKSDLSQPLEMAITEKKIFTVPATTDDKESSQSRGIQSKETQSKETQSKETQSKEIQSKEIQSKEIQSKEIQSKEIQSRLSSPALPSTENSNNLEKDENLSKPIENDPSLANTEDSSSDTTESISIEINKLNSTINLQKDEPTSEQKTVDELSSESAIVEHGLKRRLQDITETQSDSSEKVNEIVAKKLRLEDHVQSTSSSPNISLESTENDNLISEVKVEESDNSQNLNVTEETISENNNIKSEATETNISFSSISSPSALASTVIPSTQSDAESPVKSIKQDINSEPTLTTSANAAIQSVSNHVSITENDDMDEKSENVLPDTDGTESITESNPPTPTTNEKRKSGVTANKDDQRQKSWQKNVNLLWREIANHKNGAMFMNPIKEAQAPLYYDVVKYPMDLKTIKNRIRDGIIRTTAEFERDVLLMLTNSLMYNKEGTEIYQMALEMLEDVTEQIKIFKTADGNSTANTKSASLLKDNRKSLTEQ